MFFPLEESRYEDFVPAKKKSLKKKEIFGLEKVVEQYNKQKMLYGTIFLRRISLIQQVKYYRSYPLYLKIKNKSDITTIENKKLLKPTTRVSKQLRIIIKEQFTIYKLYIINLYEFMFKRNYNLMKIKLQLNTYNMLITPLYMKKLLSNFVFNLALVTRIPRPIENDDYIEDNDDDNDEAIRIKLKYAQEMYDKHLEVSGPFALYYKNAATIIMASIQEAKEKKFKREKKMTSKKKIQFLDISQEIYY